MEATTPTPGPLDRQGLEVLPLQECMRLLGRVPVGRVAFVSRGEVVVVPVNHARDGASVVFRTGEGSIQSSAARRHVVSFEADEYDIDERTGWSVLLKGTLDLVTDDAEVDRLREHGLHPWADASGRPHWVRLTPTTVSGRRIPER